MEQEANPSRRNMNLLLDVLEVGDDGKCHHDEQRPGTPISEMDRGPGAHLDGILPDSEEGTDDFGKPDEKTDEYERKQ